MKKFTPKDILIPIIGAFILVGLLFYLLSEVTAISQDLPKLSTYDQNITTLNDNLKQLQGVDQTDLDNKIVALNQTIPEDANITKLEGEILNLAKNYGLDAQHDLSKTCTNVNKQQVTAICIDDIKAGEQEQPPVSIQVNNIIYPINIPITITGDKNALYQFIDDLQKNTRIIHVVTVNMSKSAASSSWTASLIIYSYANVPKGEEIILRKTRDFAIPLKKVNLAL